MTSPLLLQRRIRGLSRAAVAASSGGVISQRQLRRYELDGVSPPLDKAQLLAGIYGCSLDDLAGEGVAA